ncbi:MAG TPA: hypothetical protein PLP66_15650, partial [Phycisphaerae bacterium]|nr:hypothetical protein [Phycisphaerae bacterium]
PADIGMLAPLASGIPIPAEDTLPRQDGVETPAGKPALATPIGMVFTAPRGLRRAVRSDGTITNAETSLMEVMLPVNEYAVFPSDAESVTMGSTRRVIEMLDHTNGSVRQIGFDDALRAGGLGNEVVRAGRSTGSAGTDRSVPWNACHANGIVSKAVVLGQLDEAIAPTARIVELARVMATRRTAGGATDFDRRVGELNQLIGQIATAKVTPEFIARVQDAFNVNDVVVSNQTVESAAAGWVPMQQYNYLSKIAPRTAADSAIPPGLLSASGLEFLSTSAAGWGNETLTERATDALAFAASFQSTLNQMVDNNIFLGPAAVPQNLPNDLRVNGAALLHLLFPAAVPIFFQDRRGGGAGRLAAVTFNEANFTAAQAALPRGASTDVAPSTGGAFGASDYAMRNGLVALSNGTSSVTVPADVAYMYISTLPSIALAQRIPLTYLGRLSQIGNALSVTKMRKFSSLVPKDQESALYLIDYVTSSGAATVPEITTRADSIIAAPSSVEKLVAQQKATAPLPKMLASVKATAGLTFGQLMETDFVQWQSFSKDGIPYLNRGTQDTAAIETVNNIVSIALSSAGPGDNVDLSNNEDLNAVLSGLSGTPRPERVNANAPRSYLRTDM